MKFSQEKNINGVMWWVKDVLQNLLRLFIERDMCTAFETDKTTIRHDQK